MLLLVASHVLKGDSLLANLAEVVVRLWNGCVSLRACRID